MLEFCICNGMSLMKRRKSIGPMMVPWGIPWSTGNRDDVHPCTLFIDPRLKFTSTGSKRHGLKSGVLVSSANLCPPCFSKQSLQVFPPFFCPRLRSALFALRFSYSLRCAPLETVRRVCWQWDKKLTGYYQETPRRPSWRNNSQKHATRCANGRNM